jgi:1,4-alpha-glucan branching enzyme
MCSILKVPRSSFYKHLNHRESNRSKENKMLKERILAICNASKRRYGAPKIQQTLAAEGIKISIKRTYKLMKILGIKSITVKKFKPAASKSKVKNRENVLNRDFSTTNINQKRVTDYQFFHSGSQGTHHVWDSKLFNYGKYEVIHFLLSNIKFWIEEYHFDGFRFDGITSMIYHDHGLGTAFDNYNRYFSMNTHVEAVTYLQFANELIKEIKPNSICIAEDMSGMPGMCLPIEYGGIGFDYRLAMGMPDFWVNTLKLNDYDWDMQAMYHELSTSRYMEKRIAYVESHDQALVGDKTFIFRMADKEMYWHMNKESHNLVIERAIALHKMARFITISLGAEGYLNFMGNEFGHPEWIDFPRHGNEWSFKHCRRQWTLADSDYLRYFDLNQFDKAMVNFMSNESLVGGGAPQCLWIDQDKKLIAYRKKDFLFIFNFHPTESYTDFELPIHQDAHFQVILDTDEARFGGYGRISHDVIYNTHTLNMNNDFTGITIYSPSRTAMVLKKI